MSDSRKIINDVEVMVKNSCPSIDTIKLKIRLEEVMDRYNITEKTNKQNIEDFVQNVDLFISARKLEGIGEGTLNGYKHLLRSFHDFTKKSTVSITTNDVRLYLSSFENNNLSTIGKKLSMINTFFEWLVTEEIIFRNPARKIKQVKTPKRLPKAITEEDLEKIRDNCSDSRERALIETLYSTGCRLSEIANMKIEQIDYINNSILVIGKGNKERIVYFTQSAMFYIKKYLRERETEDDNFCEYLFTTERRPYRKMQNRTIQDIIRKLAEKSNINKKVTPHVFRHTMATIAMNNGIQLGDLQQLLGHSSPGTTLIYAEVSETRKKNAHKMFVK